MLNNRKKVDNLFKEEDLTPLPKSSFSPFRSLVASINKYSLFSLEATGHLYSVPSRLVGLSVEVRFFLDKIRVIHEQEVVCEHNRLYGGRGIVSINLEHISIAPLETNLNYYDHFLQGDQNGNRNEFTSST